jgi:GNAT superfamily N-acetyltransferase
LDIRPLTLADIPAALRLSTQAGWNQIDADWRRLIDLWPESCLGGWHDGQLVATATLATYGKELGWVGMVLVDEACRGRGFGGMIFDAILAKGDELGIRCLGLDATDLGRPVYKKRGFVDVVPINRWASNALAGLIDYQAEEWTTLDHTRWSRLIDFDRRIIRLDREPLLRHLSAEPRTKIRVFVKDAEPLVYAFVREGRFASSIGPVVSIDPKAASLLLHVLSCEMGCCVIDVLENPELKPELPRCGFKISRRLIRMVRGPHDPVTLKNPGLLAAAGFELG